MIESLTELVKRLRAEEAHLMGCMVESHNAPRCTCEIGILLDAAEASFETLTAVEALYCCQLDARTALAALKVQQED